MPILGRLPEEAAKSTDPREAFVGPDDWCDEEANIELTETPGEREHRRREVDVNEDLAFARIIRAAPARGALRHRLPEQPGPRRQVAWGEVNVSRTWSRAELLPTYAELWWPAPTLTPAFRRVNGRVEM